MAARSPAGDGRPPTLDAPSLRRAGRGLTPPFRLELDGPAGKRRAVVCTEILRLLPAKRLVCFGTLSGRPAAVAKIYLDPRRGRRHFVRERRGIEALREAGIPTPAILFRGTLADGRTPVLLTRRMASALSLADSLAGGGTTAGAAAQLKAVVTCLASMHRAGLSQRDVHPGNFLLDGERVLVIDGADIRSHGRTLPPGPSIANLSLFLAQLYPERVRLLPELVATYSRCRKWALTPALEQRVTRAVRRWSDWREAKFLQKSLRSCTAFIARRSWRRFLVCDRQWVSPELVRLLDDPDAAMAAGTVLKAGNTATVVKIDHPAGPLVVKRYNLKSRAHALLRALRTTRARVSWRNANRLRFMGIATARPLVLLERRWGPIRRRAYFITAHVAGEPLAAIVARHRDDPDRLAVCAERLVQLLEGLRRLRLSHGDFKASNLVWTEEALYLLDLDGMRKHARWLGFQRAFRKDVQRLLANWPREAAFTALLQARLKEIAPHV